MKIYYWKTKKNFGDLLSPLLIKKFTRLHCKWGSPEEAELTMVGSILEHLPKNYKGVIAGTGKLLSRSALHLPHAKILSLRGPLTAKALNIKKNIALGDPGLLADELVPPQDKKYLLGIVPHWSDSELEHNPIFTKYNPKIIRVDDDPLTVIKEVSKCYKIVSSSLHGIMLADAFGIPRRIELPPRDPWIGSMEDEVFKWKDYSASINMELKIGLTQEADRNVIAERQFEIFDVLEQISKIFNS